MSDQSQQSQPSLPTPDPHVPASVVPSSSLPAGAQQQGDTHSLPISPFTGEPFDPAWGVAFQKGNSDQRTIQQVMKAEIERKAGQ